MTRQRISYLDSIRVVAMLMLVICHSCDPFTAAATYGNGSAQSEYMFFLARIWGAVVRPCVPLFVMLTGVLNLPTDMPMESFWKRRISRVLWPFLIWSVLYNLFPWLTGVLGLDRSVIYTFFAWASSDSQSLGDCLSRIMEIPYRFDPIATHMWYIYMLIGLYLFIPIFSAWVAQAGKRQMQLVLVIWALSTFIPYLHEYVGRYLFGECEWNEFGLFYYFSGFTGYMLLGHYIVKYVPVGSPVKVIPGCVLAFVAGAAVTYVGFTRMVEMPDMTPEQMELYWYYCSPNVLLMTVAVFLVMRLVPVKGRAVGILANFTLCGFGIYMIHYFFVGPGFLLVEAMHLPAAVRIPVASVFVIAVSWAVIAAIKRLWPRSRWLVG